MIPNVQLMTKSPAEHTPGKSRISKGKICDGQNGHRMKLPLNWPPVTVPKGPINNIQVFVFYKYFQVHNLNIVKYSLP